MERYLSASTITIAACLPSAAKSRRAGSAEAPGEATPLDGSRPWSGSSRVRPRPAAGGQCDRAHDMQQDAALKKLPNLASGCLRLHPAASAPPRSSHLPKTGEMDSPVNPAKPSKPSPRLMAFPYYSYRCSLLGVGLGIIGPRMGLSAKSARIRP